MEFQEETKNNLVFCLEDENIEVIRINKEGFFYKGEKVEDIHNVYERFNDWLTSAESE